MSVLTAKGAWALINLHTPEPRGAEQPPTHVEQPRAAPWLGGEKAFEQVGEGSSILSSARSSLLTWALPHPSLYPINPPSSSFSSESGPLCTSQLAGGRFMA